MEKGQLLDRLSSFLNLDYDAIKGYDRALDDIEDAGIRHHMEAFRDDHQRHVQDYKRLIQDIGGETKEPHRDLKGVFVEAMAAIQSEMGMLSALKAVESAEKMVNSHYKDALSEDFPPDARQVLERNYGDEKRHLAYVQEALKKQAAA